jgi:hypothetical protein
MGPGYRRLLEFAQIGVQFICLFFLSRDYLDRECAVRSERGTASRKQGLGANPALKVKAGAGLYC